MTKLIAMVRVAAAVALLPVMLVQQSFAWGADGHRMINRLAAAESADGCAGVSEKWSGAGHDGVSGAGAGPVEEPGGE